MAYNQIQKEISKLPVPAGDEFGHYVVINGYHMAAGANNTDEVGIYLRDTEDVWGYVVSVSGGVGGGPGKDMAMYGNYLVFINQNLNRIYIYDKNTTIDSYLQLINVGTATALSSIAINEDFIVVGDSAANSNAGEIYVYEKTGTDSWTADVNNPITPNISNSSDYFGCSVAIDDNNIIIAGAIGDTSNKGAIYAFKRNVNTEVWEQSQKIFASDSVDGDEFGGSISVSGDTFVAGARLKDISTDTNAGAAYIFKYGTIWYEIDKLQGVDESNYQSNHFGESVHISGDHIIIGSPKARSTGVADVFVKKRSWGHLKKILGSDSAQDDNFGTSVSISGRFIVVGSPDNSVTDDGAVYLYEDPLVLPRLAQEFNVDQQYVPSKASVYLKKIGANISDYWPIYNTKKAVIDATNFSTIDQAEMRSVDGSSIIMFDDTLSGFTGNGYMISNTVSNNPSFEVSDFGVVNYPIKAITADTFVLWIRCLSNVSRVFQAEILLDGISFRTINEEVSDPSATSAWTWINTTIVIPDTKEHILGIKIKGNDVAIDKIYTDTSANIPYFEGPEYSVSPYFTTHMRVYESPSIGRSCIAQWKLNEDAKTSIVFDAVGGYDGNLYTNAGSLANTDLVASEGIINGAFNFNSFYHIRVPYDPVFSFTDGTKDKPFSVAAWVYKTQDGAQSIAAKGPVAATTEWIFTLSGSGMGVTLFDSALSKIVTKYLAIEITIDEWHFVVATYDGRGGSALNDTDEGIIMWLDGEIYDGAGITNAFYENMRDNSIEVEIGSLRLGATSEMAGKIDNVMIFNKALTEQEVIALYNCSSPSEECGTEELPVIFDSLTPLYIYDYKNSITEVVQDDWYNFNINVLDDYHGYTSASDFVNDYYLVMSVSGSSPDNFVVWELIDTDYSLESASAIKF